MLCWNMSFVVTSTFGVVQNRTVGHISVVELANSTARFWTTLRVDVTTKFTIQSTVGYTSDCQLQLLYS
jgi:hypothetical protein